MLEEANIVKNKLFLFDIFLVLLIILTVVLTSCDPPTFVYRGDNQALYTAANNSILGMKTGEVDELYVVEKDAYGRTLYFVKTKSWMNHGEDNYVAALLISQADSDTEVSYYEYENVIWLYTSYFNIDSDTVFSFFTDEQISQLKERNDWNKNIDFDKLITKNICTSDYKSDFIEKKEIKKIIIELFGDDDNIFSDPLTQYSNGKGTYLIGSRINDNGDDYSGEYYIVVLLPQDSQNNQKYIYEKVEDIYKCQEQLNELIK